MLLSTAIKSSFLSLACGDALGVPVEFSSREERQLDPVKDMRSFGSHSQPAGTWSDDSALTFCLAEALMEGYDLKKIGENFVRWWKEGYWSARKEVFDIGGATQFAIGNLTCGKHPLESARKDEQANGNGALMRISPMIFFCRNMSERERWNKTSEVASITHGHVISHVCCCLYVEVGIRLLRGMDLSKAIDEALTLLDRIIGYFNAANYSETFKKVRRLQALKEAEIVSDGYCVNTLTAALWVLSHSTDLSEAILRAINLGGDTDTTGAVTGALAGIAYADQQLPKDWLSTLQRKDDIEALASNLSDVC